MKNIIVFPSEIKGPFFQNEIEYIKNNCNIIAIIPYRENDEDAKKLISNYGISTDRLFNIPHLTSSFYTLKISPMKMLKWLFRSEVRKEILDNCIKSKNGLKKFVRIVRYGGYALLAENIVLELSKKNLQKEVVLYSFWMGPASYAAVYLKSKGFFDNTKVVCRAHGGDLYEERNEIMYLPFREYLNNCTDEIYFISNQGKDYFTKKHPLGQNKFVSYLGTENKEKIKKIIYDKKEICIVSCSNIISVKRLDLIISVMQHLETYNIKWLHFGKGNLLEVVKKKAEECLKDKNIEWQFMGYVSNKEILKVYYENDVDFLINLSDSEGLPVSFMEAFSMGIPVIARNVGGISEILNNNCGLLLEEKWVEDNYKKIEEYISIRLSDPEKYQKISENCISEWERKFNANKNYNDLFSGL